MNTDIALKVLIDFIFPEMSGSTSRWLAESHDSKTSKSYKSNSRVQSSSDSIFILFIVSDVSTVEEEDTMFSPQVLD